MGFHNFCLQNKTLYTYLKKLANVYRLYMRFIFIIHSMNVHLDLSRFFYWKQGKIEKRSTCVQCSKWCISKFYLSNLSMTLRFRRPDLRLPRVGRISVTSSSSESAPLSSSLSVWEDVISGSESLSLVINESLSLSV